IVNEEPKPTIIETNIGIDDFKKSRNITLPS
ncbi:MAG: hypothetical protein HW384_208, partial [Dehalococcoidia bacterium]|nr:hypothetical protein [Dehalococcoidia bacterium]